MNRTRLKTAMVVLAMLATPALHAGRPSAQSSETFSATANADDPAAPAVAVAITVAIDRYTTLSEDTALRTLLKQEALDLHTLLKGMPDIGAITVGTRRTALKYAYMPPQNAGRTITLLTGEPIAYLNPGLAKGKPTEGYDLALARLDFSRPGHGVGQLYPAARITVNETGLIVTQDYARVIRLSDVERQ